MESLQKSGQNQVQIAKTRCRTSLQTVSEDDRKLLQTVKTIEDGLLIHSQLASITSLKIESQALADAFIASNMIYIADILGMELSKAQQNDILDEIGQVGWLTMADFKLFLDRMKKHKFYHKDYQELIAEFWVYANERLETAFNIELSKHEATKQYYNDIANQSIYADERHEFNRNLLKMRMDRKREEMECEGENE
jgi:hypothetical protein